MPIVIQPNDILLARAWTIAGNQAAVNTYGMLCVSFAGTGGTDQSLANDLDLTMGPFYKSLLPPNCSYAGVQVYFLKSALPLPPPVKSVTQAGPGTTGTTCLPRGIAGILKYSTGFRGPSGRGRLYLPFVSEVYQDITALPTNAYDVLVNSFASAMLNPIVTGGGGNNSTVLWALVHRKKGTPTTARQITQAESADKWGQMHKRGDYGKQNASPI